MSVPIKEVKPVKEKRKKKEEKNHYRVCECFQGHHHCQS